VVAVNLVVDQLQAGNPFGGIEDLIGGGAGIIPFALAYGLVPPIVEALGGTLVNLVDLIS
jgi:hypothetical protein